MKAKNLPNDNVEAVIVIHRSERASLGQVGKRHAALSMKFIWCFQQRLALLTFSSKKHFPDIFIFSTFAG